MLYQLSYLAAGERQCIRRPLGGGGGGTDGREALDEGVDELALLQHRVGTGLRDRFVQLAIGVAGQGDQAETRVVLAQPGDSRHAVDERHVQVDHHRVGIELVGELDCVQAVRGDPDDGQLGLVLDQRPKRFEERAVVVG